MSLNVNKIFYSIQGEGGRAGEASIFIRLSGCNMNCSFCDTDYAFGSDMSLLEIYEQIKQYPCQWIVWTGGEPTLQLTSPILRFFAEKKYRQAIETNGSCRIPAGLDYIACSPKVPVSILWENWRRSPYSKFDEFRFIYTDSFHENYFSKKNEIPPADRFYVSPVFIGKTHDNIDRDNLEACVDFIKSTHGQWRLSMQQHKIWRIE